MSAISPLQRGRLALLAAGILWSLGGVFIKRLPAGPLAITFYRSLFAALTLLPLAAWRRSAAWDRGPASNAHGRWAGGTSKRAPAGERENAKGRKREGRTEGEHPAEGEGAAHPPFPLSFRVFVLSRFRVLKQPVASRLGQPSGHARYPKARNPADGGEAGAASRLVRELAVSILLFAALLVTFVAATKLTTAANAIILQYTAPIYVIGLSALLLREPPQTADRAGLVLCMTGIAVIFFGSSQPGASAVGPALALVSGACFGLFMLWQRRLRAMDPVLLAGLNNAGAALILMAALPWIGRVSGHALLALVVMGVVQIALPYALFTWALQHVTGPEASLLTLIEPVLNPVWVALFAGEIPGLPTMIGGALILLALILRYTLWGRSA